MNSENSKTYYSIKTLKLLILLNFTDKISLKKSDKYVVLLNLSIYYTLENIKKSYKNNKFIVINYSKIN